MTLHFRKRSLISLLVALSFLALIITGAVLFIEPHGSVAYRHDWRLLGIGKTGWDDMHSVAGWMFVICGVWHLVLNWRALLGHLRRVGRPSVEFFIALPVVLLILAMALWAIPPISWLNDMSNAAKDSWKQPGDPPSGQMRNRSAGQVSHDAIHVPGDGIDRGQGGTGRHVHGLQHQDLDEKERSEREMPQQDGVGRGQGGPGRRLGPGNGRGWGGGWGRGRQVRDD